MEVKRSSEYLKYIEKNDLGNFENKVVNFLEDYFKENTCYHLQEMNMCMFYHPEIEGWIEPQINLVLPPAERSNFDIKISLDIEDYFKKRFAKITDDVEEFKKNVLRWRKEFRVIITEKTLKGRTPTEEDKKSWDEFNKVEVWISEQQEKFRGEIIAYTKMDGELNLLAHASNEIALHDELEKLDIDKNVNYYFR